MRYFFLVFVVSLGCSSETVDIKNFDESRWQADANGCDGERLQMLEPLIKGKEVLKGLNQNDIQSLLGKPDRHELYKRSQKFFYYQISPAASCEMVDNQNIFLSIRFNATGLAKEIIVMNYDNR